jgi:hypothetical protein
MGQLYDTALSTTHFLELDRCDSGEGLWQCEDEGLLAEDLAFVTAPLHAALAKQSGLSPDAKPFQMGSTKSETKSESTTSFSELPGGFPLLDQDGCHSQEFAKVIGNLPSPSRTLSTTPSAGALVATALVVVAGATSANPGPVTKKRRRGRRGRGGHRQQDHEYRICLAGTNCRKLNCPDVHRIVPKGMEPRLIPGPFAYPPRGAAHPMRPTYTISVL